MGVLERRTPMARHSCDGLSAELGGLAKRLRAWRKGRRKGARIPEPIWEEAAAMARERGVNAVASRLRLNYYALKRRVSEAEVPGGAAEFVELPFAKPEASAGWTVELEDGADRRMRIAAPEGSALDAAALMRTFWRGSE